ncbi:MAG TPA: ComEC/Rec2 family competence protein [Mycobacteriales bacterium]|nr:ComEC/Rec2 family competence protein [Mycobacteriales bacterium]
MTGLPAAGRTGHTVPDLRLLLPAAACWLGLLASARLPPPAAMSFGAAGGAVATGLVLRRRRPAALLCAAALLAASAASVVCGIRAAARADGPIPGLARSGAIAEMTVTLSGDPVRRDGVDDATGRRYTLVIAAAQVLELDSGGRQWRLRQPVLLLAYNTGWLGLLPSQHVRTAGTLVPPRAGDTVAAVVRIRGTPRLLGRPSAVQRAAGRLRDGLRQAAAGLPAGPGALLPGLVDGDTTGLDAATVADFRRTGLTHLVAVSGTNVAIISGAVLALARRLRAGPRLSGALAALAVVGFVVLARPSGSVLRAAVMGGLGLAGLVLARPRPALTGLCAAVLILLLAEPSLAVQAGFALSVLATLGLLVLAPGMQRLLAVRLPRPAAAAIAVPAAAQLACAPVIAMIGGGTSLVAVPANLLAAPAVAPATVLGVLSASTAPIAPWVARCCAELAGLPCAWLLVVAHVGARVPLANIGWPDGLCGALLLVGCLPALAWAVRHVILRR